jgi:hypothetical protein
MLGLAALNPTYESIPFFLGWVERYFTPLNMLGFATLNPTYESDKLLSLSGVG